MAELPDRWTLKVLFEQVTLVLDGKAVESRAVRQRKRIFNEAMPREKAFSVSVSHRCIIELKPILTWPKLQKHRPTSSDC